MTEPPETPTPTPEQPAGPPKRARRKRLTRLLFVLAALVLLITQTGVLKFAVLPVIESMLGCEASSGRVYVTPTGRVVVRNLELRVPGAAGVQGQAARFFRAPRAEFVPDWSGILGVGTSLRSLRIDDATVRASQGPDQALNLMKLSFGAGAGGGGMPSRLPEIELNDALLEFGEHNDAGYTPLATILVSGALRADPAEPGAYTVDLRESTLRGAGGAPSPGAPPAGMRLEGRIDTNTQSGFIALRDADLRDWAARTAPLHESRWFRVSALSGSFSELVFSFDAREGVTSTVNIDGADINIPIPAGPASSPDANQPAHLGMRGVSGFIRFRGRDRGVLAELSGNIEDLPCKVKLDTGAYSIDAGFDCTIESTDFELGERSALLPFAPQAVHDLLRKFSGPTARLSANIIVRRDPPAPDGAPMPITSSGLVTFTNGAMRYESFPYPISEVRGEIQFTNDLIKMNRLSGKGPTGATILASGAVVPDLEGPGLDLRIDAFDVPFDEHLLNTLHDIGHDEVQRIFNRPAYEQLLAAGLIRTPGSPAHENAPPELPLAGNVDVVVLVTRNPGAQPSLASDINIAMKSGGVVCEVFPYPAALASPINLRIVRDRVTMSDAQLVGLSGGRMTLDLDILEDRPVDLDHAPEVLIRAHDIPVDEYLLHAVRATSSGERGHWGIGGPATTTDPVRTEAARSELLADPASLLTALNIEGVVSSEARVSFSSDQDARYRAVVALDQISALPEGGQVMEGVGGRVIIDNQGLTIDDLTARLGAGAIHIDGGARFADGALDPDSLSGAIRCEALPLDIPLAPIAALFSDDWADRLDTIARQRRPTGRVDATIELASDDIRRIAVTGVERAAFDALGGRLEFDEFRGGVEMVGGEFHFRDATAAVRFDDMPLGVIRADGAITADNPRPVSISASDLAIGSPAVRRIVRGAAPGLVTWLESNKVEGLVELRLDLLRNPETNQWRASSGSIRPTRLSLVVRDQPVTLSEMGGVIRWTQSAMTFDNVTIAGDDFSAALAGELGLAPDAGARLTLSLEAAGLPDALRIVVPARARAALDALAISCRGPITIDNAVWSRHPGGESLDATIHFTDAGLIAGVPIEQADGSAIVRMRPPSEDPAVVSNALEIDIDAATLRLAGVRMNNARIEVRSDAQGRAVRVPIIRADVHGGSMTGRAGVLTDADAGQRFEFSGELAGVPFSHVLADLSAAPEDAEARGVNRGTLEASLSLTGALDDDARRGRGLVRVQGGDLLAMPGVVKLMEISNLQPPRGEIMEFGYADFFIQDNRLVISDLSIMSPSILVSGAGEIRWPDLEVRMNFKSQARARVAIVSDILEGIRDEFITTVARGTLYDPRLEFEQLTATRKFVETVFGGGTSHQRPRKEP